MNYFFHFHQEEVLPNFILSYDIGTYLKDWWENLFIKFWSQCILVNKLGSSCRAQGDIFRWLYLDWGCHGGPTHEVSARSTGKVLHKTYSWLQFTFSTFYSPSLLEAFLSPFLTEDNEGRGLNKFKTLYYG